MASGGTNVDDTPVVLGRQTPCPGNRGVQYIDVDDAVNDAIDDVIVNCTDICFAPPLHYHDIDDAMHESAVGSSVPGDVPTTVGAERSVVPDPTGKISTKLSEFRELRRTEAQSAFHRVVVAGIMLNMFGMVFAIASGVLRGLEHTMLSAAFSVVSFWASGIGIVTLSTCPVDHVDLDLLFRSRPGFRCAFGILCMLHSLREAAGYFPHLHMLGVVPMVLLVFRCLPATSCTAMWFVWLLFVYGVAYSCRAASVGPVSDRSVGLPTWAQVPSAALFFMSSMYACKQGWLVLNPRASSAVVRGSVQNPTELMYAVVYTWLRCCGTSLMLRALLAAMLETAPGVETSLFFISGMGFCMPPVLVQVLGKKRVFHFTERRLDRQVARRQRDGAFVAALLDSNSVVVGQEYWIHRERGKENQDFPIMSRMYNWRRGCVVSISSESLTVKLRPDGPEHLDAELQTVPLGDSNMPWHVMMARARESLRCIEWKHVTHSLMLSSAPAENWEAITRSLECSETISFFMSHSWHDDPESKLSVLKRVAREFEERRRCQPTFWLDKVCIDQSNISDGLRLLPLSIMACDCMLVLCGPTYPQRLWCIWELFTLLAFTSIEGVASRLYLEQLGTNGVSHELSQFDVATSTCYDPNEEARLLAVIDTLGRAHFNGRIRELAEACKERSNSSMGTSLNKMCFRAAASV